MLVFDTSILIDISKGDGKIINELKKLSKTHPERGAISFMTYFEFLVGTNNGAFLDNFNFLQPTKTTAKILANYQKKFSNAGNRISIPDLFIASQVRENNLTLVTRDRDFMQIDDINTVILP